MRGFLKLNNMKKFLLIVTIFLAFVGLAFTISIKQSQNADIILTNNGLSSSYCVYQPNLKLKIRKLLQYLDKNCKSSKLQVQLKSKYDTDEILVWANYNIKGQPVIGDNARYFNKAEFQGNVTFAVISAHTPVANIVTSQNNRYLKYEGQYISIIGQLKANDQSEIQQSAYYLTTGIQQQTGNNTLNNYKIIVDGLNKKQAKKVGHFLKAKAIWVNFAQTYNLKHRINPTKKLVFGIICILFIWGISAMIAYSCHFNRRDLAITKGKHSMIVNILQFNIISFIMICIIYFIVPMVWFYSNSSAVLKLFIFIFIIQSAIYDGIIFVSPKRRQ